MGISTIARKHNEHQNYTFPNQNDARDASNIKHLFGVEIHFSHCCQAASDRERIAVFAFWGGWSDVVGSRDPTAHESPSCGSVNFCLFIRRPVFCFVLFENVCYNVFDDYL